MPKIVRMLTAFLLLFVGTLAAHPGDLDPSFDGDGRQTTSFGALDAQINAIAFQSSGKIIAVGRAGALGAQEFALARYNTDGSLDTSFGTLGMTTTSFTGSTGGVAANAVAIRSDDKIVVVGTYNNTSGTPRFAIAQYTADGALDMSFGGGVDDAGTRTHLRGGTLAAIGEAVRILSDGSIIVGGFSSGFLLSKFSSGGDLDTSFGNATPSDGDASLLTTTNANIHGINDIQIGADGSITAAGELFAVARFTNGGILDTTFNGVGYKDMFSDVSSSEKKANSLAIQSDGKIVVAGSGAITLFRVSSDGATLEKFRNNNSFPGLKGTQIRSVQLQSDGKIVIFGYGDLDGTAATNRFALARFNANGSVDTTFNPGGANPGFVTTLIGDTGTSSQGLTMAIQPADGKIVGAGFTTGSNLFALARYLVASGPVAHPVTTNTVQNEPVEILLTGSDSQLPTSESLAFSVVSGPSSGTLSAITQVTRFSAKVTYTPNTGFIGTDTFTYRVSASTGTSDPATVTIEVHNDDVRAFNQTVVMQQNATKAITLVGTATALPLTAFTIENHPLYGTLSAPVVTSPTADVVYTPHTGFFGVDVFTFYVTDTATNESKQATVWIHVVRQPTAKSKAIVLSEAQEIFLCGSDPDSLALGFEIVGSPRFGSLSAITIIDANSAQVTYTPSSIKRQTDSFTFRAHDTIEGTNISSDVATITVNTMPILCQTQAIVTAISQKYFGSCS